jgi:hypothetical protein
MYIGSVDIPTEFYYRKEMLEHLTVQEIKNIIKDKENEINTFRLTKQLEEYQLGFLDSCSKAF